jgi:FkbM family methyltransferase
MAADRGAYLRTVATYAREAATPLDLWRLLRVRLSQSRLGPLVCRRPICVDLRLRSIGRVWLRSHTTDVVVLGELIEGGSYEALASAAPERVASIVDLGANTGLAACWLLRRFPAARLVAVEPHPGNLAVLRRNLAAFGDRVRIVGACIGAKERRVALVGAREDGYRMLDVRDGDADTAVVTMETVFAKLGCDRIDLLKVDVEGAEAELFADCKQWIRRVGVLSVECHHPFRAERLLDELEHAGVRPRPAAIELTPFDYDMALVRIAPSSSS